MVIFHGKSLDLRMTLFCIRNKMLFFTKIHIFLFIIVGFMFMARTVHYKLNKLCPTEVSKPDLDPNNSRSWNFYNFKFSLSNGLNEIIDTSYFF